MGFSRAGLVRATPRRYISRFQRLFDRRFQKTPRPARELTIDNRSAPATAAATSHAAAPHSAATSGIATAAIAAGVGVATTFVNVLIACALPAFDAAGAITL
jgi:hypothetical protein